MKTIQMLYSTLKDFFIRNPVVLSAYIIYSYWFISTIKFWLDEKEESLGIFDIFQRFDSLFWMWLLTVTLVKIINIRTKLHQEEKERLLQRQELEVKQMQLSTLVEIVRGLQHEVNNPLTIIMMNSSKLERQLVVQQDLREVVVTIREAAERIARTLDAFSQAKQYEVDKSPVGNIAKPPDLAKEL
ncbi:MAG TPA: histidine kinase dimerization/phospho-acceptor domain-containing protein [Bacteroidota bacterium]